MRLTAAARAEVAHHDAAAAGNDRSQLVLRRSQAVVAAWEGDADRSIARLRDALHLARVLGLPGEEWPILCALAPALAARGEPAAAEEMIREAAVIVDRLAATIEDEDVRQRFVGAAAQTVLTQA